MSELEPIVRRLRARRAALGIGQRELARRMKTAQSEISHLETGSYNPTISTLRRWAEALDLRLNLSIEDPWDVEYDPEKGAA